MRRSDVKPNASPPFTRTNWTRFCLAKLLKRHLESDSFIVRSVSRRACGMLLSRYLYGIIYFHLAVWSHSGRKSAKLMWRDVTCCYVSGLRRTQTDGWVDGRATEESLRFTSSIRICYALIFFLSWVMLGSDGIGLDNTSWSEQMYHLSESLLLDSIHCIARIHTLRHASLWAFSQKWISRSRHCTRKFLCRNRFF